MKDWISDPDLSREDKLARFEALGPEPTKRPSTTMDMPGASFSVGRTFASASYKHIERSAYSPVIPGTISAPRSMPSHK